MGQFTQDIGKEITMPLNGAIVKSGATAMTPTGGSDKTFTSDGVVIPNGIHLANAGQTDFRIREHLAIRNRVPTLNGNGTWTRDRKAITFTAPKALADGTYVNNVVRIEREVHPESSAAEAKELCLIAAQLLTDVDFDQFWSSGSLVLDNSLIRPW
jgi:hypothetical protein